MRHIDDFVIVGRTMLLRDVQFLEPGKPPVKFLVWVLEETVDGSRFGINPQLTEDIVLDSGQASSTQECVSAGVKDRVVNETPLGEGGALVLQNNRLAACCFSRC